MNKDNQPILSNNLDDLGSPGVIVIVEPEEAADLGAFQETALTEEEAWESNWELEEDRYGE